MAQDKKQDDRQIIARNKRARHDYHILDTWEAGLVLTGTEVKSLRDGKATMADAYAIVNGRRGVSAQPAHFAVRTRASSSITSPRGRESCCCTARRSGS